MAAEKGIRAGRAFVELFVDNGPLAAGLRKASAKLQAWGSSIKSVGTKLAGMGAAVAAPMIAASKAAATSGAELYDMAERTGVSIEKLSALKYAAEMSGLEIENVVKGFSHLAKSLVVTGGNAEEVQKKLRMLGLQAADLRGMSPEQLFETIAAKLEEIPDPTLRAAAAMQFFGESGTQMIPLINNWSRLNEEAKDLGFIKNAESARRAKEMANLWTILSMAMKSVASTIGSALYPVLEPFMRQILDVILSVRDWLRQNKELIQTVFRVAVAVFAAGGAFMAVGLVVGKLGAVFGVLAGVMPVIGAMLSALVAVIGFLITPIGAVIAVIAVLAGYWLYSTGAMAEAAGWLGGVFNGLKDDACKAFGGISDALAAGDFALAARILWTTLKIWWTKGTNWISSIWNDAMGYLTQRFYESIGGWRLIFEEVGHGLMVAWIEVTNWLGKVWYEFTAGVQQAWAWCALQLQKSWNKVKELFTDFDAGAANKAADEEFSTKVRQLDGEKDENLRRLNEQYEKEKAGENALHQAELSRIITETEAAKTADQEQRDAKERANEAELEALQKERDAMVKKARDERVQHDLKQKLKKPGEVKDPKDLMKNSNFDVMGLKQQYAVSGTFSAMGAWGLAGGSAIDRTAKATEKTAKGVEKLVDIVDREGGPTFA